MAEKFAKSGNDKKVAVSYIQPKTKLSQRVISKEKSPIAVKEKKPPAYKLPSDNQIFASDLGVIKNLVDGKRGHVLLNQYQTSPSWVYNRVTYLASIDVLTKKKVGRQVVIEVTEKGKAINRAYNAMLKVIKRIV